MNIPVRVIIVENSQDTLERVLHGLQKGNGTFVHKQVKSLEQFRVALMKEPWDIVISRQDHPDLHPDDLLNVLHELDRDLPLVLLTETKEQEISSTIDAEDMSSMVIVDRIEGLIPAIFLGMRQAEQHKEQKRMEKVQNALLNLSRAALTTRSLGELYRTIHTIIGELMPAENFYICLYDAARNEIWFPYYVDEIDEPPPPQQLDRGLTAYVLRSGKPLLASPDVFETLVMSGDVELIGAPSIDWLGVPLIIDEKVIGAVGVQSYTEGVRFTHKDLEILQFVSTQVAMTIDRKRAEEALKAESQFRKAIEDSILAGIMATNLEGHQTYVNPAFCRMVGWSSGELLGASPPYRYWPPEEVERIQEAFRVTTGIDALPSDFELVFQRRNGDRFDAYLLISPLLDGQGQITGWLSSVYDITARKRDEEAVQRQKARAEALARTAARLNARLDLNKVLETVCEETALALNVPAVSVFLYDSKFDRYELRAAQGWPDWYFKAMRPIPRKFMGKFPGKVNSTIVIPDIQMLPDPDNHDLYLELNLHSAAISSMVRDKTIVGCLGVFTFDKTYSFTPNDIALLESLGDLAAQAISNARLFTELERSLQQVRALNAVDVAINASLDLRVTLNILLDQAITLLDVDAADVWMYNPVTQELEYAVGRGFHQVQPTATSIRLGDGFASRVVIERKLLNIQDLGSSNKGFEEIKRLPGEGLNAYVGVPLIAKGQVKGVLEIFRRTEFELTTEWIEMLDSLAGQAAIAIDNANLFDQLQRSNEDLIHSFDATLENWVRTVGYRNGDPDGHIDRVVDLTLNLARQLGVREEDLVQIRRGALLHDVGMVRVPDYILKKPIPLSKEERDAIELHPNYANQMLSPIAFLRPCVDIPYCHHERWDGSGYPRRLSGKQIPLAARIFAVVDVWDALRSERPYRPAWETDQARNYLHAQSGVQFDPEVVHLLMDMV
jgi:PAS domain S-box-containing protein